MSPPLLGPRLTLSLCCVLDVATSVTPQAHAVPVLCARCRHLCYAPGSRWACVVSGCLSGSGSWGEFMLMQQSLLGEVVLQWSLWGEVVLQWSLWGLVVLQWSVWGLVVLQHWLWGEVVLASERLSTQPQVRPEGSVVTRALWEASCVWGLLRWSLWLPECRQTEVFRDVCKLPWSCDVAIDDEGGEDCPTVTHDVDCLLWPSVLLWQQGKLLSSWLSIATGEHKCWVGPASSTESLMLVCCGGLASCGLWIASWRPFASCGLSAESWRLLCEVGGGEVWSEEEVGVLSLLVRVASLYSSGECVKSSSIHVSRSVSRPLRAGCMSRSVSRLVLAGCMSRSVTGILRTLSGPTTSCQWFKE